MFWCVVLCQTLEHSLKRLHVGDIGSETTCIGMLTTKNILNKWRKWNSRSYLASGACVTWAFHSFVANYWIWWCDSAVWGSNYNFEVRNLWRRWWCWRCFFIRIRTILTNLLEIRHTRDSRISAVNIPHQADMNATLMAIGNSAFSLKGFSCCINEERPIFRGQKASILWNTWWSSMTLHSSIRDHFVDSERVLTDRSLCSSLQIGGANKLKCICTMCYWLCLHRETTLSRTRFDSSPKPKI